MASAEPAAENLHEGLPLDSRGPEGPQPMLQAGSQDVSQSSGQGDDVNVNSRPGPSERVNGQSQGQPSQSQAELPASASGMQEGQASRQKRNRPKAEARTAPRWALSLMLRIVPVEIFRPH